MNMKVQTPRRTRRRKVVIDDRAETIAPKKKAAPLKELLINDIELPEDRKMKLDRHPAEAIASATNEEEKQIYE